MKPELKQHELGELFLRLIEESERLADLGWSQKTRDREIVAAMSERARRYGLLRESDGMKAKKHGSVRDADRLE